MSTKENDGSRFLKAVLFYGKVFRNFWAVVKSPRQSWTVLKNSRITSHFVFALFVSELTGLAVIFIAASVFSFLGYRKHTAIFTVIAISHYLLDLPFDFWLWPRACRSSYPIRRWKAMYAADMGYFYLAGKAVDWVSLAFKEFLAMALLSHFAFPGVFAASLSHAVQIPLYMFAYTVLCVPMLLAREEELPFALAARQARVKRFVFALDRHAIRKSVIARVLFWRRRALAIELCEWLRLYSIQARAGPLIKIFTTPRNCGAFFMALKML
jgi:hypothetical protein